MNPTRKDKSKADIEIVEHFNDMDVTVFRRRNLSKIAVGQLNINSIRSRFEFLAHQVKGNTDILMI